MATPAELAPLDRSLLRLRRSYALAFVVILVLLLSSQAFVQAAVARQESDAPTVNRAGRQRMLSQRIAKAALAYSQGRPAQEQLLETVEEWRASHRVLKQGVLPGSPLAARYTELDSLLEPMAEAAEQLALASDPSPDRLDTILAVEPDYLALMDHTVGMHTAEAQARVARLRRVEALLFVLALLTLALEAAFIFAPALRRLRVEIQGGIEAREQEQSAQLRAEATSAFLAQASHELRTPLNGIVGVSELLGGSATTPEQGEYIELLQTSSEVLLALVDDLLDLSKLEAGRGSYHAQRYDLDGLIRRVIGIVRSATPDPELRFVVQSDPALPAAVWGDPRRVQQILLNLVSNAVRFTATGEVTVRTSLSGERVQVAVEDTGIGMTSEEISRIFAPFEQVGDPTARRQKGTGLGLAIARRLVEDMGGRITVESVPGVGSTFTFSLPAHPAEGAAASDRPPPSAPGAVLRVLLVDDHPTNRAVGQRLLQGLGHEARTADSGQVALDILASDPRIDLVLMDLNMPGMDGYETTRRLRASGIASREVPVLACSASTQTAIQAASQAAGMDGFVSKPVTTAKLALALSRHTRAAPFAS